jgi:hypothetical protein
MTTDRGTAGDVRMTWLEKQWQAFCDRSTWTS